MTITPLQDFASTARHTQIEAMIVCGTTQATFIQDAAGWLLWAIDRHLIGDR